MDKSNICSYLIAEMEHKVSKHLMIEVKEMMNKSFLAGQVHAMRQEWIYLKCKKRSSIADTKRKEYLSERTQRLNNSILPEMDNYDKEDILRYMLTPTVDESNGVISMLNGDKNNIL